MKRVDLQALAEAKIDDATLLFSHGRHGNAYHLAGYAIELGLKACIARQISADKIPDPAILRNVLTHEFDKLIGLAGLKDELKLEQGSDADDLSPNFPPVLRRVLGLMFGPMRPVFAVPFGWRTRWA